MKSPIYLDIIISDKFSDLGVEKGINVAIIDMNENEGIHGRPVLPYYHLIDTPKDDTNNGDTLSDISKKIKYIKDAQRYLAIAVLTSEEIKKCGELNEDDIKGLVFLCPTAREIDLQLVNMRDRFFRISNTNHLEAKEMVCFIKEKLRITNCSTLVLYEDENDSKSFMNRFFEELSISPTMLESWDDTDKGNLVKYKLDNGRFVFLPEIENIEKVARVLSNYESIVIIGESKWELVFFIQRLLKSLPKTQYIGSNIITSASFEDHKIPKQRRKQAGSVYYTFFPVSEDFSKKFENAYGYKPSIEEASGYDIIHIACDAIKNGGLESELISRYLKKNSFNYSLGLLYFADTGETIRPYNFDKGNPPPIIKILEEGDFIEYKKYGR